MISKQTQKKEKLYSGMFSSCHFFLADLHPCVKKKISAYFLHSFVLMRESGPVMANHAVKPGNEIGYNVNLLFFPAFVVQSGFAVALDMSSDEMKCSVVVYNASDVYALQPVHVRAVDNQPWRKNKWISSRCKKTLLSDFYLGLFVWWGGRISQG